MKKVLIGLGLIAFGFMLAKFIDVPGLYANDNNYTLADCITRFDKAHARKSARGWAFWFVKKDVTGGMNVKMSQVAPRQAHHGAHKHDQAEVFYILHGSAEFTLRSESTIVGPNSTLYCPPGITHGIRNAGTDSLRYLVIKNN